MVCIWDNKIRLSQFISLKSFWQSLVLPDIKPWIISACSLQAKFSLGIKWHNSTDVLPQSCPGQAQLRIWPFSHNKLLKHQPLESSPAWSPSPVLVSHALGVAMVISFQSVLLEWNCLEIILSAAHLAFGTFAKRLLALFWNKDSHLYWDFGSIPCCRIFSKLLGASLLHFISWLFWLPPSYFYTEATKIFSSAWVPDPNPLNSIQSFPANFLRLLGENKQRYLKVSDH